MQAEDSILWLLMETAGYYSCPQWLSALHQKQGALIQAAYGAWLWYQLHPAGSRRVLGGLGQSCDTC